MANDYCKSGIANGISMNKLNILLMIMVISSVPLFLISCDDDDDSNSVEDSLWKVKKESRLVAEDFLIDSPTFTFDGIEESIEQATEGEAAGPEKWRFLFSFYSEHEGYGDRSDEELDLNETYHEAYITVKDGEVIAAIIDDNWDMIDQEGEGDWEWREAGKQALYGVISVFTMLVLLIILTRVSGYVISRIEKKQNITSSEP